MLLTHKANAFLDFIIKKYVKIDKAKKGHHLLLLEKIVYDRVSGVHKHKMKLVNYHN